MPHPSHLKYFLFAGRLIPDGDQFSINPSGTTLRISQVHPAHQGIYECRAENVAGTQTASAKLEVKARGLLLRF